MTQTNESQCTNKRSLKLDGGVSSSASIQLPGHKEELVFHGAPSPSLVPKYLRPGKIAQFRDITQWIRFEVGKGSSIHKRLVMDDPSPENGAVANVSRGSFVFALQKHTMPINGSRRKHFAPKVMRKHVTRVIHRDESLQEATAMETMAPNSQSSQGIVSRSVTTINDLPLDALVKVFCHLCHADIVAPSQVSKKFNEAAQIARMMHFNFMTPDQRYNMRSMLAALNESAIAPRRHPSSPVGSASIAETPAGSRCHGRAVEMRHGQVNHRIVAPLFPPTPQEDTATSRQQEYRHADAGISLNSQRALFDSADDSME